MGVHRSAAVSSVHEDADGVTVRSGALEPLRARWVVAADGAASTPRAVSGTPFRGDPARVHMVGGPRGLLVVLPMHLDGWARVVLRLPDGPAPGASGTPAALDSTSPCGTPSPSRPRCPARPTPRGSRPGAAPAAPTPWAYSPAPTSPPARGPCARPPPGPDGTPPCAASSPPRPAPSPSPPPAGPGRPELNGGEGPGRPGVAPTRQSRATWPRLAEDHERRGSAGTHQCPSSVTPSHRGSSPGTWLA
ncbi:FAD-dependent oxidoreductase [Streptomyces goshikiensis]|uniref:FAD-dependent oxidoreductase n=1 Tax=Streptomyces goshikiensis TaxID=1942 RepID=UPI0036A06C4D